ncbi:hypothetical protein C0J52_23618 [Blattella germanica]|nr:hypothetical protein C0J52_23618 [Blattella germanica]
MNDVNKIICRMMWAVAIVLAFLGAVVLVIGSWTRYEANRTVVSLEKNYRDWDTVFPAFTICYLDKLNFSQGKEQIKQLWGDADETRKKYYLNFLSHIANASLANLHEFQQYDGDSTLDNIDLEDLALKKIIVLPAQVKQRKQMTVTVNAENNSSTSTSEAEEANDSNSEYQIILSTSSSENIDDPDEITSQNTIVCAGTRKKRKRRMSMQATVKKEKECVIVYKKYRGNGDEVSARKPGPDCKCPLKFYDKFYVHPPDEMPMYGRDKSQVERKGEDREVFVVQRQMVASQELRHLYPMQRGCLFQDETVNAHPPIYTYNICKMECRKKMALHFCNCIPFFYRTLGRETTCNTTGMACLAKYKDNITNDVFRNRELCPCYQQCESMDFTIEKETTEEICYLLKALSEKVSELHNWDGFRESLYEVLEEKIQFRIKIEEYTKTRYRRDIIFSYEDLVVSFGGTVSLFLGCSILSGVELVYFFTIRLICRLWMQQQATNDNRLRRLHTLPLN